MNKIEKSDMYVLNDFYLLVDNTWYFKVTICNNVDLLYEADDVLSELLYHLNKLKKERTRIILTLPLPQEEAVNNREEIKKLKSTISEYIRNNFEKLITRKIIQTNQKSNTL